MPAPTSLLRPFVPAQDYSRSRAFYTALGFRTDFEAKDVTGFSNAEGSFLLQNFWVEQWAHNFMMHWMVADLDAWFANARALDLPGRFGVKDVAPPARQPWGLVIAYMQDPSGVLWHVAQHPGD